MALAIKLVPVADLKPAAYNPRAISPESLEGLKTSLTRFGMVDPVIVNTETGNMVGGHQRLTAAIALGWTEVPCVHVKLSLIEEKALNVTLNNQRISGHFTEGLQALLEEIHHEFDDIDFEALKLDELVIHDAFNEGGSAVNNTDENLDGLKHTFKVKCPPEIKDEVLVILKRAFIETSLEGVEVV